MGCSSSKTLSSGETLEPREAVAPLTLTRPAEIRASPFRREEAAPARARKACNLIGSSVGGRAYKRATRRIQAKDLLMLSEMFAEIFDEPDKDVYFQHSGEPYYHYTDQ